MLGLEEGFGDVLGCGCVCTLSAGFALVGVGRGDSGVDLRFLLVFGADYAE